MEKKINEYFKGINLRNVFKNFLCEEKKIINFFTVLYIFYKNDRSC